MKKARNLCIHALCAIFVGIALGCSGGASGESGDEYEGGEEFEVNNSLNKSNAKEILGKDYLYRETVEIPDGITSIGSGVFTGSDIKMDRLIIPASVTKIESGAFNVRGWTDGSDRIKEKDRFDLYYLGTVAQWCEIEFTTRIVSYYGNNGIVEEERRGGWPLENARHFITYDEENTKLFFYKDDYDEQYEYMRLVIPSDVKRIKDYAFYRASCDMSKIVIEKGVQSIGKSAFEYTDLRYAIIPGSVKTISEDAFYGSSLQYVEIGDGVESIGKRAFSSCWLDDVDCWDIEYDKIVAVDAIRIPGSVKSIGESAFSNQWTAKGRKGWNSLGKLVLEEGVETIEAGAFSESGVKSVVFPSTLVSIGKQAFYGCFYTSLGDYIQPGDEIIIPEGVKLIGESAFEKCKSLSTIALPYSLETIGYHAFYDCVSLKKVILEGYGGNYIINRLKTGNLKLDNGVMIN